MFLLVKIFFQSSNNRPELLDLRVLWTSLHICNLMGAIRMQPPFDIRLPNVVSLHGTDRMHCLPEGLSALYGPISTAHGVIGFENISTMRVEVLCRLRSFH